MSDSALQYPREKRPTQQDIDARIKKEMENDDEIMDHYNSKPDPSKEIRFTNTYQPGYDEEHDKPAKEDDLNSEKRAPLTSEHQNNENDINAYNTAGLTVADVMFIRYVKKNE